MAMVEMVGLWRGCAAEGWLWRGSLKVSCQMARGSDGVRGRGQQRACWVKEVGSGRAMCCVGTGVGLRQSVRKPGSGQDGGRGAGVGLSDGETARAARNGSRVREEQSSEERSAWVRV